MSILCPGLSKSKVCNVVPSNVPHPPCWVRRNRLERFDPSPCPVVLRPVTTNHARIRSTLRRWQCTVSCCAASVLRMRLCKIRNPF